jgi:ribosomal-protein-alanine N-acetyltransferase
MAVLQRIRDFFVPEVDEPELIVPAPETTYRIRPLTDHQLPELVRLNLRCFKAGENYTKHTFTYLLNEPNTLSYRAVTPSGNMVAFIFVMVAENGVGHITTIGVAPEHRRRGLAVRLLEDAERALQTRGVGLISLEVRVGNDPAQFLYRGLGFSTVQRLKSYYNNGEDAFLMVKSI